MESILKPFDLLEAQAGADAWKSYMRRQTCADNWSTELQLAQRISFMLG
jgi:aldehyde dehydrogenase (NAD+)